MKTLLVSLTLVALVFAVGGCDKPEPEATLEGFDTAVDGGAPAPAVWVDRSILQPRPTVEASTLEFTPLVTSFASPSAPAAQPVAEADAAMADGAVVADAADAVAFADAAVPFQMPGMASPDEPAELKQVREVVGAIAGRLVGEVDVNVILDVFVPDQAARLRQIVARFDGVKQAADRLREVGTPILGEDPFMLLGEQTGGAMAPAGVPAEQEMDPEEAIAMMTAMLPLERISGTEVGVLGQDGSPSGAVFRNVSGQWLLELSEEALVIAEQVIGNPAAAEVLAAVERVCENLTDGLQGGELTSANFAASAQAAFQIEVLPSLMGLKSTVMAAMAESQTDTMAESPAPANSW